MKSMNSYGNRVWNVFEVYELKNMRISSFRVRIKIEILMNHTSCKSMDAYRNKDKEFV